MPILLKLPQASVSRIEEESDSAHLPLAHGPLTLSTLDSGRYDGSKEEKVLLLTIGDFHYRLLPHLTISHSPFLNTYTLPPPSSSSSSSSSSSLLLTLPFPSTSSDELDQTTLLTLLLQYLTLLTLNPPSSKRLKNKLLLIDDETGAVVGEMDAEVDDSKGGGGGEGPVMVDLNGRARDGSKRVVVTEVPKGEMDDWMLKGAANLGGKMLKGATLLSTKMSQASERYVERTVPNATPTVVSDRTKANLRVLNKSTLAVRSTVAKGTGFINRNIQKGVEFAVEHGHEGSVKALALAREKQAQRKSSHSSFDSSSSPQSPLLSSPPNEKESNDLLISFDDDNDDGNASSDFTTSNTPARKQPPPVPLKPSHLSTSPSARAEQDISKRPLFSRLLLAGDVLYTSFGSSYETVLASTAENATKSITHKYGEEAGSASAEVGGSVGNVSAAFFDARGVGRRALVKGAGKGYIKTRMKDERGKVYSAEGEVVGRLEGDQVHQGQLIALANEKSTPPLSSPSFLSAPPPLAGPHSTPSSSSSSSSSLKEKSASWSSTDFLPPPPPNRVVLPPPVRSLTRPSPSTTPPPPPLATRPKPKPKTSTGWQRPKAPTAESFESTTKEVGDRMGGLDLSGRDRLRSSPEPVERIFDAR